MWDIITVALGVILCAIYLREAYLERKAWREFMKGMEPDKNKDEPAQGGNHGKG